MMSKISIPTIHSLFIICISLLHTGCSGAPEESESQLSAKAQIEKLGGIVTGIDSVSINLMENPNVKDDDLKLLAGIDNLTYLSVRGTDVGDAGMAHIANIKTLETIDVSNSLVTDAGLKHLSGLNISSFHAGPKKHSDEARKQIGDAGLAELCKIKTLRVLSLERTNITSEGVASLELLPKLGRLNLALTAIDDEAIPALSTLTSLTSLDLSLTGITDEGVIHLETLTNLNHLLLLETAVSNEMKAELLQRLPGTVITLNNEDQATQ